MSLNKAPLAVAVSMALCLGAPLAHGVEVGGLDLTGSGFLTLGVGKMLNGGKNDVSDFKGPIFVSDYAQAGVYESKSGLQWQPDTKLGLQGTATLPDKRFSVTGQIVSRGARDGKVNLEWLYGSYKINNNFTLQVGRKRIPMFYYSETQDVGLALPWTHLPSQLYGWEAVNYNGVNLAYQGQWGAWSSAINLVAGQGDMKETGYAKIYLGKHNRTDVKWENLLGGDITLSKDWLETRFVYLQSKNKSRDRTGVWEGAFTPGSDAYGVTSGPDADWVDAGRQQIYGLTFNVDYNNFLVRSEVIYIDRDETAGYKDHAQILGVGYRLGKWTPMVTVSNYRLQAITAAGTPSDATEAHRTTSLTLRYDLTTSSALKIQYDHQRDRSGPNYTMDGSGTVLTNRFGNARLLTMTYDMVF